MVSDANPQGLPELSDEQKARCVELRVGMSCDMDAHIACANAVQQAMREGITIGRAQASQQEPIAWMTEPNTRGFQSAISAMQKEGMLSFSNGHNDARQHTIPLYASPAATGASSRAAEGHDLYTNADANRPEVICDSNGQVVLAMCKRCGRGEVELKEPCRPRAAEWREWVSASDVECRAQHDETTRTWEGPLGELPRRFAPFLLRLVPRSTARVNDEPLYRTVARAVADELRSLSDNTMVREYQTDLYNRIEARRRVLKVQLAEVDAALVRAKEQS